MRGSEGECLVQPVPVLTYAPDLLDHATLDLGCWQRLGRARVPAPLLGLGANVVAIAWTAVLAGVGGRHGASTRPTAQQPLEQSPEPVPGRCPIVTVALQEHLHALPDFGVHDGLVRALVNLVPVSNPAEIGDVGQQLTQ